MRRAGVRWAPAVGPLLLAAVSVLSGASPARAGDPIGPGFGRIRYRTTIQTGPQGTDTDDYVAPLFDGEALAVTVTSPLQSPLLPAVSVLDPTGADRTDELRIVSRRGGRQLRVTGLTADITGRWTVRVSSLLEKEGTYVVSLRIVSRPLRLRGLAIAGGEETEVRFAALEGALCDVIVRPRRRSGAVEVRGLDDPAGEAVPGAAGPAFETVRVRRRRSRLRGVTLRSGDGEYALQLAAPKGAATCDVVLRVRPQGRPVSRRVVRLGSDEPYLAPPPLGGYEGIPGLALQPQLQGRYIAAVGNRPTVLFGENRAVEFRVSDAGTRIDVEPPEGVRGETVDVTVINPDGQGYRLEDAFYYVPEPAVTDLTDLDGNPTRGWSTDGGRRVRILGTNLRSGQVVQFGPGDPIVPLPRDGALELTTPAAPAGSVRLRVTDRFEQEAVSDFDFEFKDPPTFGADPYDPPLADEAGGTEVRISGPRFEAADTLLFDGAPIPFQVMGNSAIVFEAPAGVDGTYSVEVRDRVGVVVAGPRFRIKAPGIVDSVVAGGEASIGGDEVALAGGAGITVTGSRFHVADTVTLGGADATVEQNAVTSIQATAPAGDAGLADLVVTDAAGQETVVTDALRFVGYADRTADRSPGGGATDDLSALRGVVADLDGDESEDDVVITSSSSSPGTRTVRTRILVGDADGSLVDRTAADFPGPSGGDDWNGSALGVGDVDGADGTDILVAGAPPDAKADGELRVFLNDGAGVFSLAASAAPGSTYTARVTARDETGSDHEVYSARTPRGLPSALAVGDLDGDDDLDIVIGRDHYESFRTGVDPTKVDFGQNPPYVSASAAATYLLNATTYLPATRVLLNEIDLGNGFVESSDALPSAGGDSDKTKPALHARDVALGDIDGDDDLDIIITWDDPTTVTAYGMKVGAGNDSPQLATRVLVNDGAAGFTDATATWLPAAVLPEFYQAHRLKLVDLDGDDDLDLLLVIASDVNRFQGSSTFQRPALRVLRNDGSSTGFTDVTSTAIPAGAADRDDNFRGVTLAVVDANGDDSLDILVGTTSVLRANDGTRLRSTRLLLGGATPLAFRRALPFLPAAAHDSGEADDLLVISDLAGNAQPSLLLLSETTPAASGSSEHLRILDWER